MDVTEPGFYGQATAISAVSLRAEKQTRGQVARKEVQIRPKPRSQ